MRIGTKSVLFGAHAFWIHPFFVALAWLRLYGFGRVCINEANRPPGRPPIYTSLLDPRLWIAFFVHDLGYFGKPNIDGEEGERHPWLGARIMARLFDRRRTNLGPWGEFVLFHSRFLARRCDVRYSPLCVADKLAVALEPWWLYLPRVILSGEIHEYMGLRSDPNGKYAHEALNDRPPRTRREWHERMTNYCRAWAYQHVDGRPDTWTPEPQPSSPVRT